ncbi:YcgL domain-containing protein [Ferrimonas sediminicola]|uniref:YcgL domain-containing protein FCL40_03425 n=1 Tax=Ferrimonas sediminicola TaxID=2569538 RepID=A0A4U1BG99_9GAMM|nr:YcgL domain-containing protein [Ferrimonas sediminicola]TKB50225.1 YcgL domain-containing protein [Ferrimonas sediminicola]
MICAIYKSTKKAETYLFINKRDDFSQVPQPLMDTFGRPQFVMILPLAKVGKLAQADIDKVREGLNQQGFYLQLPPPQEDLLKTHKEWIKSQQQE